jgi:hypothetical protein
VEQDASGKTKKMNCRYCYEKLKKELKTVTRCKKCKIPLHTGCFKEWFIISMAKELSHKIEGKKWKLVRWFISISVFIFI